MKRLFSLLIFTVVMTGSAIADGFMIPRPMPWMPPSPAVNVKYHHVDVEINDPMALTKIDQVFVNPYHRDLEADYIFPIPEGAALSRFTAWLGGHKMEAELLDAGQARRIYEDIVRKLKDPALLEYAGRGMYRLRIFPIPARGDVRIKIEYEQTLKSDNGTVEYLYPLNTEKYSGADLEECKIDLKITSFENIGSIYCPTHSITTERLNDRSMVASFYEKNTRPNKDFILHFARQNRDFGFHILSYRQPSSDDGYFLGILSPPLESRLKDVDKSVIFILDSSGSMRGEKMRQAIDALKFCLLGLNAGDDFSIIDYDDAVRPYKPGLIKASSNNIEAAIAFAEGLDASGGTDIYDALDTACRMIAPDGDPTYIIFLTDGLPTSGNTDIDDIIRNTTTLNEGRARMFVFGVGYDVNAHLLDRLSRDNKGAAEYVLPDEDIEIKVSRLASKISHPALTDLALVFNPMTTYNVYPDPLPDLFYGSEIVIAGRFQGNGSSRAVLSGKAGENDVTYQFPIAFSSGSTKDEYIALLWANRRIGYLLQQMRLHGTSDELLTEVVELSRKYGIITEYTSFLVTGDEHRRHDRFWHMPAPEVSKKLQESMDYLAAEQVGRSAVTQSKNLQSRTGMTQIAPGGEVNIGGETKVFTNIAQVGAQAFFQSGNNWIQGDIKDDHFDIQIKRFSPAYFQLLEKDPSLGRYLALGDEVRLKIGGQVVQIADSGKEHFTDIELKDLFRN
jgi:Ca-activated chloride channel family protein